MARRAGAARPFGAPDAWFAAVLAALGALALPLPALARVGGVDLQGVDLQALTQATPAASSPVPTATIEPRQVDARADRRGDEKEADHRDDDAVRAARQRAILRVLGALAATVILAIFAAHPRVRRIENRFGLTLAVASGLPFLLLGAVFQHRSVGILDAETLKGLAPFLEFGLGWVGFLVGLEFDVRKLDDLPEGTAPAVALQALVPFLFVSIVSTVSIALFFRVGGTWSWRDPVSLRNGLLIGACGALSASTAPLALARGAGRAIARVLDRMAQLNDVAALIVLLVVGAFFRPLKSDLWQIPAIGWLFVTIGFGGVLGMLTYALIRGARTPKEELAFILGAICFCAGVSGRLALSPLVVCAIAGALLANLPRRRGSQLFATLRTVERPVFLLFMLVAGATLPYGRWEGWALLPLFVVTRAFGKMLGVRAAKRVGPAELRTAPGVELAMMPQSPMGVATMLAAVTLYLSAKDQTAKTDPLGWIALAVVLGGYFNDVGVQIVAQYFGRLPRETIDAAAAAIHLDPHGGGHPSPGPHPVAELPPEGRGG